MFKPLKDPHALVLRLVVLAVFFNGLLIVVSTLINRIVTRSDNITGDLGISLRLIIGLSFIYLATLLNRRKRTAWAVAMALFLILLSLNISEHFLMHRAHWWGLMAFLRNIIMPGLVALLLAVYRQEFNVKSDIRNFTLAIRTSLLVLAVAFLYGVVGFQLLDTHDFHQEIGIVEAAHRTVDQFDFTTSKQLVPHSRRAKLFVDSLSVVSGVAVAYSLLSLFQPLKGRFSDQSESRAHMEQLLRRGTHSSEDFFKLWPHDKTYFINKLGTAALAYHVQRGVALIVGDIAGATESKKALVSDFLEYCRVNDWLPAFIHTDPKESEFYKKHDFGLQKIGEEAILDIKHFSDNVAGNKYFRHINNKFTKQDFSCEVLLPPHNPAIVSRLKEVSNDWLGLPGRSERRLMMGYFSEDYIQQCPVMVLRDAAGTIQAFINQIPSFDPMEANYDLLRYTKNSPGNANDFLLLNFIGYIKKQGFKRLNLGLCPLSGLDKDSQDQSVIDNVLQFVYANGDRFYSFSGLRKFKAKYEPNWSDRFIAYRGGVRGLTRTMYALNKAMKR